MALDVDNHPLVDAPLDGEEDVKDTFERFQAELRQFGSRVLRNRQSAADLPNEVYLQLVRFPPRASIRDVRAYVFKVAWHVVNRWNSHARRGLIRYDSDLVAKLADRDLESRTTDMEDDHTFHQQMEELLKALPPQVQAAFLMAKRDGMKHKVIAHRLGVSIATINKYVRQTVLYLKQANQGKAARGKS